MKIIFCLFVLLYQIVDDEGCRPKPPNDTEAAEVWDYYVRYSKTYPKPRFPHFRVPLEQKIQYGKWLVNWAKNREKRKLIEPSVVGPVPPSFSEFGELGEDPPPWAFIGKPGRPFYCYRDPDYGDCDSNYTRYGFNTFTELCELWTYSGCGGNFNNFVKKCLCILECEMIPVPGCGSYDPYDEY